MQLGLQLASTPAALDSLQPTSCAACPGQAGLLQMDHSLADSLSHAPAAATCLNLTLVLQILAYGPKKPKAKLA